MRILYSYKDAIATIRRTTTEHNYQLVITRAYEEGEEQLLEEDEESEYLFRYHSPFELEKSEESLGGAQFVQGGRPGAFWCWRRTQVGRVGKSYRY